MNSAKAKRLKRAADHDAELPNFQGIRKSQPRSSASNERSRTPESYVGERVSFKLQDFLRDSEAAVEPSSSRIVGTCEAWSPYRQAFLVVFDEPFGEQYDRYIHSKPSGRENNDESSRTSSVRVSRLSVALWNEPDKYITYDSGPMGWGGTCTVKRGIVGRRSCHWFGSFIDCETYLRTSNVEDDEALFCLCRRVENAEPPPPLAADNDDEDSQNESSLIECDKCKEWYHVECIVMATKRKPSEDAGEWECPLCEGRIKSERLSKREDMLEGLEIKCKSRLSKWLDDSNQKLWRRHPPVQWQFWTARHAEGDYEGEWVYALCTLRRFVNKKQIDDSVIADSDVIALHCALNRASHVLDQFQVCDMSVDYAMAFRVADLKRDGLMPRQPKSNVAQKPMPCSRTRSVDEHLARRDVASVHPPLYSSTTPNGNEFYSKGHSTLARQTDASMVEDSAGRNQRLEIRRVASAVGESALTIGRKRRLRFGRSKIHMWGVYADETLTPGDFVAEYKGELISQKETDRRFNDYMAKGMPDYLFKIETNLFCDATMKGSLARFINHSCDPNCEAKIVTHQNQKKIALYAVKDIMPGEELCYDYKFPIEEGENKIACNCGAKRCRKVMN